MLYPLVKAVKNYKKKTEPDEKLEAKETMIESFDYICHHCRDSIEEYDLKENDHEWIKDIASDSSRLIRFIG